MNVAIVLVAALVAAVASIATYLLFTRRKAEAILLEAGKKAEDIRDSATREGEAKIREAELVAKERLLQARNEFEKFSRKRRSEHEAFERRLLQKEDNLDKRQHDLNRREQETATLERTLARQEKSLSQRQTELDTMVAEERQRLEQLSGLTAQQAKDELIRVMEKEARNEAAHLVKRIEDEANEQATRNAQRIIANAIQRNASDYVAETTVSVVLLPNDEMKGRIIGREGRNIRALEMATGVDLIVDDTPEAVILSGFDPFRREIARVALERLITDGRIHPARIEEVVEKTKAEFDVRVQQEGDAALLELNIPDLHPELVKLLGKLRFRTSYGQNVLKHSKEVAYLAATMAAELRVDVHVAKRAGLLHDIGKAVDREMEGSHLELGIDLPSRRLRPANGRSGAGHRGRRPLGRPSRRPPRGTRELHQTPREAGRDLEQLQGCAEELRHPGRPRSPRDRRFRQVERRRRHLARQKRGQEGGIGADLPG